MFLCRRQFLRVHFANFNVHHFDVRKTLSHAVRPITASDSSTRLDCARRGPQLQSPPKQSSGAPSNQLSTNDILSTLCEVGKGSPSPKASPLIHAMELYAELRNRNLDSVAKLPVASYFRILDEAYSNELIDVICKDIVELFKGTGEERRKLLHLILLQGDLTKLRVDTLLSALHAMERTPYKVVERLARFVAEHDERATIEPLARQLYPLLLGCLRHHYVPSGAQSLAYYPPSLVHAAFGFAHKLIILSFEQLAVDLLHFLFNRGFIPSEAIYDSKDPSNVVSGALVRASIHWNWKQLAAKTISHLLRNAQPFDQPLFELAVDTSYALLDTPRNQDIRACRYLLVEMHRLAPIPSGLVRKFYNIAAEHIQGKEAASFYLFSRTTTVTMQHRYPPPQGTALTWLMHYLVTTSRKLYLSRVLATEVVEENLPIDPQSRARFITLVASQGHSTLARNLWIRYSIGKDSYLVAGNSALMLRMTSLFAHLIRRASSRLRRGREIEALGHEIHDLVAFRNRVLWSYRRYHGSLMNAPHMVITSYARACFIVGNVREGFKAFSIMLRRKEIPDMYDINVALSAIARYQPCLAASAMAQLKDRGIQPDAVSYATVMHYAERYDDSELVQEMIHLLRHMDKRQLDLKSIAALIRSTVAFKDDETRTLQHQKLQDAMDIITSLTSNQFIPSPQTGKYLVVSSLRADNPVMAYRFWELLLRESAEWDDHKQRFQRQLIRRKLNEHRQLGLLGNEEVEQMMEKLSRHPVT
ncbi:hypothetical protein AX15_000163 [Amanita polypyramis BW_CC]|nr:hypothetical protein AX15_000163 [Amanita polypyramis BW_CC]